MANVIIINSCTQCSYCHFMQGNSQLKIKSWYYCIDDKDCRNVKPNKIPKWCSLITKKED
jgi:hypothetical protein